MRRSLRLLISCAALLAVVSLAGATRSVEAAKKRATVTVVNKSSWVITHFFLSSSSEDEWGPDQLGRDVIGTGESFKLTDIPCDTYDVRLVDEDDDECIVMDVDICGGNDRWEITSKDLLRCQGN
jgi:hypothetical protein